MKMLGRLTVLLAMASIAACTMPDYRWVKQGVDQKTFDADRSFCVNYVNEEFNPYYDYGPVYRRPSVAEEMMHRNIAADEMYRACMHGKGYKLIAIQRDAAKP